MDTLSIITPLYRSANHIQQFYDEHLLRVKNLKLPYEFLFVNDGSPDDSETIVKNLISKDPHVRLISLSRNFGQQAAIFAGLANATGGLIYIADCDLEEPPEALTELYQTLQRSPEVDVVFTVTSDRCGGIVRGFFGSIFYKLLNWFGDVPITPNQSWQRIMRRSYVGALLQFSEVETIAAGLLALAGFKQVPMVIKKKDKGYSSYTFYRRSKLALNSLLSYSSKPLFLIGLLGISITLFSFLPLIYIVLKKMIYKDRIDAGWTSLICSIWIVGGLILSSIGIVGIYLSKVFNQVKKRPLYIIKSVQGGSINSMKNISSAA